MRQRVSQYTRFFASAGPITNAALHGLVYLTIYLLKVRTDYIIAHPPPGGRINLTYQDVYFFFVRFEIVFIGWFGLGHLLVTYEKALTISPAKIGPSVSCGLINSCSMLISLLLYVVIVGKRFYMD